MELLERDEYLESLQQCYQQVALSRQIDVLHLLQKGLQNQEIADKLFISSKTVDHHISAILSKLEVNSRVKSVAEASRLGILK